MCVISSPTPHLSRRSPGKARLCRERPVRPARFPRRPVVAFSSAAETLGCRLRLPWRRWADRAGGNGLAETIAIVAIIVAAVVAVGVGIYQVRAGWTRPNPQFRSLSVGPAPNTLSVVIDNPGGAAAKCSALAHCGDDYYEFRGGIVSGQGFRATMTQLGHHIAPTNSAVPLVLWVAADDGHHRWWDAIMHRRIYGGIDPWLNKKSTEAGLAIPVEVDAGI